MTEGGWHGYKSPVGEPTSAPETVDTAALRFAERQLRRQRRMGRSGHCGYDLARHIELAAAVKKAKASLPADHTRSMVRAALPVRRDWRPI